MLFLGMGGREIVCLYFMNLFVSHLVNLLIPYLCIYWILFKSFWIFVIVFSGVVVRLVSAERGVFLRSKQEEKMPNECFKEKKNKLKDCCVT